MVDYEGLTYAVKHNAPRTLIKDPSALAAMAFRLYLLSSGKRSIKGKQYKMEFGAPPVSLPVTLCIIHHWLDPGPLIDTQLNTTQVSTDGSILYG